MDIAVALIAVFLVLSFAVNVMAVHAVTNMMYSILKELRKQGENNDNV